MRDISNIVFGAILSAFIGGAIPLLNSQLGVGLWLSIFLMMISSTLAAVLYSRILSTLENRYIYSAIKGYWRINVSGTTERDHAMAYIGYQSGRLVYKGWGINSSGGFVGSHWDGYLNSFKDDCLSFNTSATIPIALPPSAIISLALSSAFSLLLPKIQTVPPAFTMALLKL